MANSDFEDVSVRDASPIAKLSPAVVVFMESHGDRHKDLLAYLVRERSRGDAESAVNGFIAVCVLVAIAASFLMVL